ncbi:DUF6884 domain-containing protein [Streptomyces sp. NPDC102437]|uniref:DUF6884 domain-containing protein n=1 Tax=Streptomyces sp. NPDC102437 TaxID=3366175 RepID=UPI0038142FFE
MGLRDEGQEIRREDGTAARRPLWDTGWGPERAARYAARCARYVDTDRLQLLDAAEQVEAPAARWPVAAAHGEQLALFDPATPATAGPVVVIPCSEAKVDHAAPAGQLYVGKLHTHARRTADALTAHGGTVLVLSALHGFLPLDQVVEPYDHTWEDAGSVTVEELRAQAAELGLTDADVVLLTPSRYTQRAVAVWPQASTPLAHLGIGRQRGRLTAMREHADHYTTAA